MHRLDIHGSLFVDATIAPPSVKLEMGLRTRRYPSGCRLVRERSGIHNRVGAKRGSARGKPLEKPRSQAQAWWRSETQVPEGSRSTLQFVKSERGRDI